MTTITLPRAVVEQALEALEAIREADTAGATPKMVIEARSMCEPTITALRAALAQQAEPGEPVAWVRLEAWKSGKDWPDDCFTALPAEGLTPLCKCADTPPQRKPLTDEEIRDLWSWAMTAEAERTATTQQHAFARAVERAHGIGEGA